MPPWTDKQLRTALAIEHSWKPKGKAKGFTKAFAKQVIREDGGKKKGRKRKGRA